MKALRKKILLTIQKLIPKTFSREFGYFPIDRYYINKFILLHNISQIIKISSISLEFGEIRYSKTVSGQQKYWEYDNVFFEGDNYFRGDFLKENKLKNKFDLIIATQVLPFVPDPEKFILRLKQSLKHEGFVILTSPGLGIKTSTYDYERWGDFARYSDQFLDPLLNKYFNILEKHKYGNIETVSLMNLNIDCNFIHKRALDTNDYSQPVVTCYLLKNSKADEK